MSTVREMDAELSRLLDAGRASIVVEINGVSFIDSVKLRLYVSAGRVDRSIQTPVGYHEQPPTAQRGHCNEGTDRIRVQRRWR